MHEYIKREDAEKVIIDIRKECRKAKNFNVLAVLDKVYGRIHYCVENADVVPVVHGYWKFPTSQDPVCSVCGRCYDREEEGVYSPMTDYCGNCGARMDGDKK